LQDYKPNQTGEKMNEIVKVDASQYGLQEDKAKQISGMFTPMLDKMVELEKEYNKVAALEVSKESCIMAGKLRREYVKVRTGTAAIHKDLKSFYLNGGRFVDGWKNAQKMASEGIEEKLLQIEKHYERAELERVSILTRDRETELSKYGVEYFPAKLGEMETEVWQAYLTGIITAYKAKIEAEKKAEEDRVALELKVKAEQEAKEKAEAEERKRINAENEKLKAEAKAEYLKRQKEDDDRQDKEDEDRRIRYEAEQKRLQKEGRERRKIQEALNIQEAHNKKLRKEKEDAERVEKLRLEKEERNVTITIKKTLAEKIIEKLFVYSAMAKDCNEDVLEILKTLKNLLKEVK